MNDRLYSIIEGLPDTERKVDRQLFFGSIFSTLNHILYGDIAWMSRFLNKADNIPPIGEDLFDNFEDLRQSRTDWDRRIDSWSSAVDEIWLSEPFSFTSRVDGKTRTKPAWMLVVHMFNHGTHHRGQLTVALSQLGRDYGSTDIPFLPDD